MSLFQLLKKAITTNYDQEIKKLESMGFSAEEATKHLKLHDGNMELALEVKLSSIVLPNIYHAITIPI